MPQFEITGKGRDTGRNRKRVYTADSIDAARALAEADGTQVETVTEKTASPPKKKAAARRPAKAPAKSPAPSAKSKPPAPAGKVAASKPAPAAQETEKRATPAARPTQPEPKAVSPAPAEQTPPGVTAQPQSPPPAAPTEPTVRPSTARATPSAPPDPAAPKPRPEKPRISGPWAGMSSRPAGRSGCLPVLVAAVALVGLGGLILEGEWRSGEETAVSHLDVSQQAVPGPG